jgi:serine/threonine protein phosphatase PrpC
MKVFTYSNIGKRDKNEDEYICKINLNQSDKDMHNINLFGVFDGHGGGIVSKYLKYSFIDCFMNKKNNIDFIFSKCFKYEKFANIFNSIEGNLEKEHPRAINYCGSTACIIIEYLDKTNNNKYIYVCNVGDSRAIKCDKHNTAIQLSHDHKPNRPDENQRIKNLGGKIIYDGCDWRINGMSLSRAFGDKDCRPFINNIPEVNKYIVNKHDKFIILACDGIWDVLSNQEAVDYILNLLKNKVNHNLSKLLAEYALAKGSTDNVTVIIYLY